MPVYQPQSFNNGGALSSKELSTLVANDIANYQVLLEQPRGVIYFKKAWNLYNNTSACVTTTASVGRISYANGGPSTLGPIKMAEGIIPVEASRRYYIEFSISTMDVTTNGGAFPDTEAAAVIRLSIDGASRACQWRHIPWGNSTSGSARFSSCRCWYIHETPDTTNFIKSTMKVTWYVQQQFDHLTISPNPYLRAYLADVSGQGSAFMKVEDWGSTAPSEIIL
jgi:hypothetical protein